jgi:hypothetical protein
MGTTNSTRTMSPEWGALEHDGQPHRELSLLSLQEVIVELTRSEDALREHRWADGDPQDPAKTIQVMHLRARQRVILHELRRRTRRRARLRQVNNEPSAPAPKPAPGRQSPCRRSPSAPTAGRQATARPRSAAQPCPGLRMPATGRDLRAQARTGRGMGGPVIAVRRARA